MQRVIRESPYQSRTANEIVSLSNDYHSRHTTKCILNIGSPNAYNASFKIPPRHGVNGLLQCYKIIS
ncbi:hypothetical protein OUZ56_002031 [Daphnia magna]|uniref:Uncharacterized protein n=1 Tax=Daphnia magna TaxID=35525 RepID=A0ABR0A4X2_9CRUS|nr:hypothetical protein OUZ56_002031 [Daphnia magna]